MNVLERIEKKDFRLRITTGPVVRNTNAEKEIMKLAEIGQLALNTQICYWEYQYADGDCQEGKCVRNELCKMKASK